MFLLKAYLRHLGHYIEVLMVSKPQVIIVMNNILLQYLDSVKQLNLELFHSTCKGKNVLHVLQKKFFLEVKQQ